MNSGNFAAETKKSVRALKPERIPYARPALVKACLETSAASGGCSIAVLTDAFLSSGEHVSQMFTPPLFLPPEMIVKSLGEHQDGFRGREVEHQGQALDEWIPR